jgi:hypothetical protein
MALYMIPDSFKIAFAALDAVWAERQTEDLAGLLGGMAVKANDQDSMDSAALQDWKTLEARLTDADQVELVLAYLKLNESRYGDFANDISKLIDALRSPDSRERAILDSVIPR